MTERERRLLKAVAGVVKETKARAEEFGASHRWTPEDTAEEIGVRVGGLLESIFPDDECATGQFFRDAGLAGYAPSPEGDTMDKTEKIIAVSDFMLEAMTPEQVEDFRTRPYKWYPEAWLQIDASDEEYQGVTAEEVIEHMMYVTQDARQ